MKLKRQFPPLRQAVICVGGLALWLLITILFIGFRPEHLLLALLVTTLFFAAPASRRLVVALLPFVVFGISYDWMNLCPNYQVNSVDVQGIYEAEKSLFGIGGGVSRLTPNEFFAIHNCKFMDVMAGIFYLCWVPLPIFYGLWLLATGKRDGYLHFALVFLLVNFIGFALYYVYPAAPPWYVSLHGFEAVPGTPGDVAGLGSFDAMTGTQIFHGLYARNANVFAAFPSLHSAYTLVAFIYAVRNRNSFAWKIVLGIVTLGIWFTAVYTSHHYIIDVLGGIMCALAGYFFFEALLMGIPAFRRWVASYERYITPDKKRIDEDRRK